MSYRLMRKKLVPKWRDLHLKQQILAAWCRFLNRWKDSKGVLNQRLLAASRVAQTKSRKRNWINQKSFYIGEMSRFFIVADDGGLGLLRLKFKGLLFFDWRVARILGPWYIFSSFAIRVLEKSRHLERFVVMFFSMLPGRDNDIGALKIALEEAGTFRKGGPS